MKIVLQRNTSIMSDCNNKRLECYTHITESYWIAIKHEINVEWIQSSSREHWRLLLVAGSKKSKLFISRNNKKPTFFDCKDCIFHNIKVQTFYLSSNFQRKAFYLLSHKSSLQNFPSLQNFSAATQGGESFSCVLNLTKDKDKVLRDQIIKTKTQSKDAIYAQKSGANFEQENFEKQSVISWSYVA